ncbi:MAG: hypothetical protein AAGF44_13370, partial [Pseudomonadota bacterium]
GFALIRMLEWMDLAFGGQQASWSFVTDIYVSRLAGPRAELCRTVLFRAWGQGSFMHNYYYMDERLIDGLAERIADWRVRPTRPRDWGGWVSFLLWLLIQFWMLGVFLGEANPVGAPEAPPPTTTSTPTAEP